MKEFTEYCSELLTCGFYGNIFFVHSDKTDHTRSFNRSDTINLVLRIPRNIYVRSLTFYFYDDFSEKPVHTANAVWSSSFCEFDDYELKLSASIFDTGLHFFSIKLDIGYKILFSDFKEGDKILFSDSPQCEKIQFTVFEFAHCEPKSFLGGIIYHIFVDRFNRSNNPPPKPGAKIIDDWSDGIAEYPEYPGAPMKNNTFFGGTLHGVIEKLDYIQSLGANIIYLSPIFEAASNHKYDTADYMKVDSMFGGEEALRQLVSEVKKRNMHLVLDGVFNHTGNDSVYFNRFGNYDGIGAYQSKSSPYFDWYCFDEHPNKYVAWWDIEILPRLNLANQKCADFFVGDGGVIEKYMNLGISGFRLDVADELSDLFITRIKEKMSLISPENILYGEVWEDASNKIAYDVRKKYYLGKELDGVMNYPLRTGILNFVTKKDTSALAYVLSEVYVNAPKRIADTQMNLLGTHDTERIITVLGGESSLGKRNSELKNLRMSQANKERAVKLLKAVYTVIATLPGIPSVFYGDEAGLEGYGDPFNRMPFPWGNEDLDLLNHYKKTGAIRRANAVYEKGEFSLLLLTAQTFVFSRSYRNSSYITAFNNSENGVNISFAFEAKELYSGKKSKEFFVNGYEGVIFKSAKNNVLSIKRI